MECRTLTSRCDWLMEMSGELKIQACEASKFEYSIVVFVGWTVQYSLIKDVFRSALYHVFCKFQASSLYRVVNKSASSSQNLTSSIYLLKNDLSSTEYSQRVNSRSKVMASTGLRLSNNALNQNERSKLSKRSQNENADSKKNEVQPAKRAALGTLTNTIRIQPFRAAKGQATASNRSSNEANVFAKVAHSSAFPSQGFSVYVDEDSNKPTALAKNRSSSSVSSENLNLDPAVTALSRLPLTEVFLPPVLDSPMLLDSSDEELDEPDSPEPVKNIDSNADSIIDVPEYAAEIHDYLKNAEV